MFEVEHVVNLDVVKAHRSQHGVKCQDRAFLKKLFLSNWKNKNKTKKTKQNKKKSKLWIPKEEQKGQNPTVVCEDKNSCNGSKLTQQSSLLLCTTVHLLNSYSFWSMEGLTNAKCNTLHYNLI